MKTAGTSETSRYLIVGGGLTADAACRGIRELDPNGTITVVADELYPPYARPPLSKALWKGGDEDTIWCRTGKLDVDLRLGRRIVALDLQAKVATDVRGNRHSYERLLLATGGRPRRLACAGDEVIYFRTLDDYHRLRARADQDADVVVIGGGFIGCEIAAALAMNGCTVKMVFPDTGIGARIFPATLSAALGDYYRDHGVELISGASVTWIADGRVTLGDGRALEAGTIVAGIGIDPNVELAARSGLQVKNGIVVDAFGRVEGGEDVFAAGDVARFPSAALGGDRRVEHEDHAKSHGRSVGRNMAGAEQPYDHLPFFYSDLFDLGYEAVGELDSRLEVVADGEELGVGKNVYYYVDGERRPRGILLWKVFGQVDAARELIRAGKPVERGALTVNVA
jgi:3-phenylpropionate/trans-cinnamate dioxygenase ferredoxin reductase component